MKNKNESVEHALSRWINPLRLKTKRLKANRFSTRQILKYLLWAFIAFVVLTASAFAFYSRDLPTPGKIAARTVAQSTQIYDRNGKVLYSIHGNQNRTVIPLSDIAPLAQQATLAAEDSNFYHEPPFDIKGIIRAAFNDIFSHSLSSGGSTITQQYVKNALLTPDKTFARKIKELIVSIELAQKFSKDDILTFYLNEIPYGSNSYGIQAASQTFFNKNAKDLDLAQAATLAAILNAPTYFSPYGNNTAALTDRQHYVLDRMVALKMITKDQATAAEAEKLTYAPASQGILAPHFVMYVKQQLEQQYGEQMVEEGGLKVTTTLDYDMQIKAEQAVADNVKHLTASGAGNAALTAMDPKTGQILAMVGSENYFDTANNGNFNVATASRQPGSSFKPIVYATAFKGKYNPAFTLWDVPTTFGDYTPQNYNGRFNGPVTMRTALQNSLNIPAVKTLALVGVPAAIQTAHDMGITTLNADPSNYGLSLVLGGGEVKLVDMVDAYSTFAAQGVTHATTSILKIQDSSGKVLEQFDANRGQKQSLDPQIAYEISNVLSDNNSRAMVFGLHSALAFSDRPVAAKTGTTSSFRDGWTVGYTPSLTAGVWVGNNNNTPMKNGEDGVITAAPIFHEFMTNALKGTPVEQFTRPAEIKDVTVDKFSNKLPTDSSPETVTDIFASWQAPTSNDDIHVKVNINKLNGLLATSNTPSELIEQQTFTNLHSEKPSDSNWENPVLAYAQAHNINVSRPPTQQDNLYTDSSKPTITITSPTSGQNVSGAFTIQTSVTGTIGIKQVEAFIDGQSIGVKTSTPYSFAANTNTLSIGSHEIKVVATDANDATASSTMTLTINQDSIPPASVSNVSATVASASSVALTWLNPISVDLAKIHIYVSATNGSIGSLYPTEPSAQPNANGSFTVTGLTTGIPYYFTLKAVDSSGNESAASAQVTATPH